MIFKSILFFAIAFFLSNFLLCKILPLFGKYLLDKPNTRSSHSIPIPTGGGISFVALSIIGSFINMINFGPTIICISPVFCLPIAIVGLIDDFLNLKSIYRLVIQFFSSILIIFYSPLLINDLNIESTLLAIFLTTIVIALINFVNFMDGIDGLVGSCMFVLISSVFLYRSNFEIGVWILGSLLGFIFWNWSPAKIFMGDIGSTFLGAYYSFLVFQSNNLEEALSLLLITTPLTGDALICVLRRFFAKQNPFKAHKVHLYQRLVSGGLSHRKVSLIYIICTFLSSLVFLLFGIKYLIVCVITLIIIGYYLDQKIAKPFCKSIC